MRERRLDDQQIASLVDGRLEPVRRDEVLAELAGSEDDYFTFVETAAALHELREAGLVPKPSIAHQPATAAEPAAAPAMAAADAPIPLAERRRRPAWRGPAAGLLAMAALLAALALGPRLWRRTHPSRLDDPARAAALLHDRAGLPPGLAELRFGSTTRGAVSPRGAGVKLGAWLVDLEVAVAGRDTAAARVATRIATLLRRELSGAGPTAHVYDAVADEVRSRPPSWPAARVAQGRAAVRRLVPADAMELGVWTEAARIAAARGDAGFFRTRESRRALEHAAAVEGLRPAVREVEARLPTSGPIPDRTALVASLETLLAAAGT